MTPWEQELEDDLDWRIEELDALKHQINQQKKGTVAERALLRAIWAMLYAHYEGYCKFVFNIFVDELEALGVNREECKSAIIVLSLEQAFKTLRGNHSSSNCYEFFTKTLHDLLHAPLEFHRNPKTNEFQMKGESNLYPAKLSENCEGLCLPHDLVATHHTRLFLLVKRRNGIAHGENVVVTDILEYKEFEDATIDVMHELALSAIESINQAHFLRPEAEYDI